ncbi:hypothetical protein [Nonomuraea basaltis]|uniref:hypothetical protein n=1 Tax=Nonomuraea basaltis TaxID=2495887 RepID=UPI0014875F97|nr:hypothetical protein [Nonomuraea basaltis]
MEGAALDRVTRLARPGDRGGLRGGVGEAAALRRASTTPYTDTPSPARPTNAPITLAS